MFRFGTVVKHCAPVAAAAAIAIHSIVAAADDGKRAVDVPRFGVHVRVPQAWELVDWSRDDTAFVVDVPQDRNSPVGHVTCTVVVAPEDLKAYRDRYAAEDKASANKPATKTTPRRKLLKNEPSNSGPRLTAEWEFENVAGVRWYERRVLLIEGGMLYTFTLDSDESHYDAYAAEFDEMLTGAKLKPLATSLEQIAGGYWMQRDFRFALKLPAQWRPNFGSRDRVLFFATGASHGLFNDNLAVMATPSQPLDLNRLAADLPAEVKKRDPTADVSAKIVPQGNTSAVETITQSRRGDVDVTILERRFATAKRNYEIRLSCAAEEFSRREKEFREMLDGFIEVPPPTRSGDT